MYTVSQNASNLNSIFFSLFCENFLFIHCCNISFNYSYLRTPQANLISHKDEWEVIRNFMWKWEEKKLTTTKWHMAFWRIGVVFNSRRRFKSFWIRNKNVVFIHTRTQTCEEYACIHNLCMDIPWFCIHIHLNISLPVKQNARPNKKF